MRIALTTQTLEWAVGRSGRRADLVRRFPKLPEWLSGAVQPTMRQLEAFSKAAAVPFGYLLLKEPPAEKLPIPNYRTLEDEQLRRASPDLLETVYTMQKRQAWMREFLLEQGLEPLPFVGSAAITDDPISVAERIRETLNLEDKWAAAHSTWTDALRALRMRTEEVGILVVVNGVVGNNTHRKLDPGEFRGFILVDQYAPLVFVNGADGKAAQMFTLAHELAHVWFGSSAAFDLRALQPADNRTEQICNKVAAEFLVPAYLLNDLWPTVRNKSNPFQVIAKHFKVSTLVVARRLLDLEFITRDRFFGYYREWQSREDPRSPTSGGGDFYANQNLRIGRRFGESVVRAAKEGRLLYSEAYRLTGLYGATYQRYAETAFGIDV